MTLWEDLIQNFRKRDTKEWDRSSIAFSVVFFFLVLVFAVYITKRLKENATERKANLRYTIGVTGARHKNFRSSNPTVEFFYTVNEVNYSGTEHIGAQFEKTVVPNGGRYFVEFSSIHPSNSKLLLDYPVPDSIVSAMSNGWTLMPGYTNKN
jgi:hypothetical protein